MGDKVLGLFAIFLMVVGALTVGGIFLLGLATLFEKLQDAFK